MDDICLVCKKSAEVSCTCDKSLRFCSKDYFFYRKEIKGDHHPIDLAWRSNSILLKNFTKMIINTTEKRSNENNYNSIKFSKNVLELKSQLKSKFNLFLEGHTDYVTCVIVTKDNKYIISGSDDRTIRIWNLLEQRQEGVLEGHFAEVLSVAVTSDNKYVISGSDDNTIRIWNLLERRQETILQGHVNFVNSVAVTSNNKYAVSGSGDKTIRIWNLLDKKQESVLEGHSGDVSSVAITTDDKYIVSGSDDKSIRIWNFLKKSNFLRYCFSVCADCS